MAAPISVAMTLLNTPPPPVIGACTVPYITALTESWNIIGGLLDVTNAFQNKILVPADRIYVLMPPYYLQWFWRSYPWIKIKYIK